MFHFRVFLNQNFRKTPNFSTKTVKVPKKSLRFKPQEKKLQKSAKNCEGAKKKSEIQGRSKK
jgi:hypothetical protein